MESNFKGMIQKLPAFFFLSIFLGICLSACKKNTKDRFADEVTEETIQNQALFDTLQYQPLSGMKITRLMLDTNHIISAK